MADRRTIHLALLVWSVTVCAAPSAAQPVPPVLAPISLDSAVGQALDRARIVQLALEDVSVQQATVRQAVGAFDSALELGPLFEHREDAIENTPFFNPERVKRGFAKGLHEGFGLVADALADQLRLGRGDLPLCPTRLSTGTDFSAYYVTLPGTTFPVPLCRPASLSVKVPNIDDLGAANSSFLFRQALPFDPLSDFAFQSILSTAFRVQVSTASLEARERSSELLQTLQATARIVDVRAGLISERLGVLPDFSYTNATSLFGQHTKPLRNGSVYQVTASFDGRANLFRDKPIDPSFGGNDTPNRFNNLLEFSWTQPLKRGRGAVSVRAPERAALKNVEATRFNFQQTSSDQALATADAYFDLMATQESLALIRDSLTVQRQMVDITTKLIAAGNVPAADLTRARARTSEVESDVETARLAVVSAQTRLAKAMGLPPSEVMTLGAADAFPAAPLEFDMDAMSKQAVSRRADVKAVSAFRETSRILLAAAKADTRSRFDVRLSGGVTQVYRGPVFRSLPDEIVGPRPTDSYIRYYSPVGFGRAFQEPWEPVAAVTGNIELPFGNNQQIGRFAQAVASSRESEIRVADLSRSIENNLPKLADAVRQVRAEWDQRQEAVVQYETTWSVAQQLRNAGDMTLIDALLTEQQLTQARLQLIQAKRDYASAVAHFRRETGALVEFTEWWRAHPNFVGLVTRR